MKVLGVIAVLFCVTGCASVKSMEQLEYEASISGDWSEVEKRERIIARREEREGLSCPNGYISFCDSKAGAQNCGCVTRQGMRDIFAGR